MYVEISPRQSGKTEAIKKASKELDYYKIFVSNKEIINIKFVGIKNVHTFKEFFTQDLDSIAYKIFVDEINIVNLPKLENPKTEPTITIDSPGIYAATSSTLDFDTIQRLIQVNRFSFERICIVNAL